MEPEISVGILWEKQVSFVFNSPYLCLSEKTQGKFTVSLERGKMYWKGRCHDELIFEPQTNHASFTLKNVIIGINFHWQRKEDQQFEGALKLIIENDQITAINIVKVEGYLTSVISSEMSATASLGLLKAHAVISRSWFVGTDREEQRDQRDCSQKRKLLGFCGGEKR